MMSILLYAGGAWIVMVGIMYLGQRTHDVFARSFGAAPA